MSKYTTYNISEENFVFGNKKYNFPNIILCDYSEYQDKDKKEALHKILLSINININDNGALELLKKNESFSFHVLNPRPETDILVFGLRPSRLMLQGFDELYISFDFLGCRIMFVGPLSDYLHEKNNKLLLWNALRVWKSL
ncbi:MAG: hypothetical protein HOP11_07315 [Saprospiraceae bacterium]|nr:hypothetical protein [Saprospiraceae bacterium]